MSETEFRIELGTDKDPLSMRLYPRGNKAHCVIAGGSVNTVATLTFYIDHKRARELQQSLDTIFGRRPADDNTEDSRIEDIVELLRSASARVEELRDPQE